MGTSHHSSYRFPPCLHDELASSPLSILGTSLFLTMASRSLGFGYCLFTKEQPLVPAYHHAVYLTPP